MPWKLLSIISSWPTFLSFQCTDLVKKVIIEKTPTITVKVVINGAGASAMACSNLFKKSGVPQKNITMVDRTGVIFRGRENLNQWKSSHAIETKDRTLDEAIKDAIEQALLFVVWEKIRAQTNLEEISQLTYFIDEELEKEDLYKDLFPQQ